MTKAKTISVIEPPRIPTLNFGRRPGIILKSQGQGNRAFVPQTARVTQHKGGPSGGGGK